MVFGQYVGLNVHKASIVRCVATQAEGERLVGQVVSGRNPGILAEIFRPTAMELVLLFVRAVKRSLLVNKSSRKTVLCSSQSSCPASLTLNIFHFPARPSGLCDGLLRLNIDYQTKINLKGRNEAPPG